MKIDRDEVHQAMAIICSHNDEITRGLSIVALLGTSLCACHSIHLGSQLVSRSEQSV